MQKSRRGETGTLGGNEGQDHVNVRTPVQTIIDEGL